MDLDTVARLTEAIVVAIGTAIAWLAKQHAKDASTSVGPKNGADLQTLAKVTRRNQRYMQKRVHDLADAMTANNVGVELICKHLGITLPDVPASRVSTDAELELELQAYDPDPELTDPAQRPHKSR